MKQFPSQPEFSGISLRSRRGSKEYYKKCSTPSWEFYEPPENISPVEFCQDTSLHGLQYVGQPQRHLFERIFWLIAVTVSVIAAGHLIYKLLDNYNNNPVETVFTGKEMPIENIPCPAVTICNVNNLKLSKVVGYERRFRELSDLAKSTNNKSHNNLPFNYTPLKEVYAAMVDVINICNTNTFVKRIANQKNSKLDKLMADVVKTGRQEELQGYQQYHNPTRILREGSQSCKDMILFCMVADELLDCDQLFYEVETDYGSCCTFNTIPLSLLDTFLNDSRDLKERVEEWQKADLSWDNLIFTQEESSSSSSSQSRQQPARQIFPGMGGGLTVLLNPDLKEWYCSDMDSEGFVIGINGPLDRPRMRDSGLLAKTDAEIFINVRPEITMSDESIRNIDIEKRNCLFGTEKQLAHYSKYTSSNCLDECIANRTLVECQCVQYYMPRRDTDELCKPAQYNCSNNIRRNIMQEGLAKACSACLPTCTDIKYRAEVSSLNIRKPFIDKHIFGAYPELRNKSDNMSIVHVYFGVDSTYPRMRKEVYSKIDLISNTGGLLGLCMGFSMLSLLEIVYYCSIRICCRIRRKQLEKVGAPSSSDLESDQNTGMKVLKQKKKKNWLSTGFYRRRRLSGEGDHVVSIQQGTEVFKIVRPKIHISSSSSSTLRNPDY